MNRRNPRVLIAGSIAKDTNFVEDHAHSAWGGTVLYAARTYHDLGVECRVVTSAAEPIAAEFPDGVELVVLESSTTTTFENHYHTDQSRTQRAPRLAPPLRFDPSWLSGIDLVHLGPLHPDDLAPDWYRIANVPCALDVQGLCRRVVDGEVLAHSEPTATAIVRRMRWLKASVREWSLLGDPDVAGCELALTRGIEGGELRIDGERSTWRPQPAVTHCDPTGAGDVFFAAFLTYRHRTDERAEATLQAARFTSEFLKSRPA